VQSFDVVDLLDVSGQAGSHSGKGLVSGRVDLFDLQRLHEALRLRVVIGVPDAAHGPF